MERPPLRLLHESSLSQVKLARFRALSTQAILASLRPGQPGALRVRPDGLIMEGNHRIRVLQERGVETDLLPREIIHQDGADDE